MAWIFLTYVVLAVVIYLQHVTLGRRWAHNEVARRALGICTVMGAFVPLAATGIIDLVTWAVVLGGFVIAGGVIGVCWADEDARERERKAAAIREHIENGD